MDLWDKSFDRDLPQRRRFRRQNPSFSSSLLDAIYRSIDESNSQGEDGELIFYRETTAGKKQSIPVGRTEDDETFKFRRACMIEKWMDEKQVRNICNFTVFRSSSSESNGQGEDGELIFNRETTAGKKQNTPAGGLEDDETVKLRRVCMIEKWIDEKKVKNIRDITVSSSTSTAGRRFSSSESELPSLIKTTPWTQTKTQKPKHENGFNKTKSKASKINHDLKKVKQPISPGGRLANFLNSLFNGGSPKTKQKIPNPKLDYDMSTKSKSQQGSSTCSSASSFSRSCLSKTPSSRGNVKRSVRFCPVSVIVDEDCRPCGHKLLQKLEEPIMKKGLKSYENLKTEKLKTEHHCEEDEDDDAMSCSSSDLFELDNLSVNGIERYREELPVYETTNFKTNCANAKGLVVV